MLSLLTISIILLIAVVIAIILVVFLMKTSTPSTYSWHVGGWNPSDDDCQTKNCGPCTQTRPVTCMLGDTIVDDKFCIEKQGEKPESKKQQKSPDCLYGWSQGSPWDDSDCKDSEGKLKVCGEFYETKTGVFCEDQFGRAVESSKCVEDKVDKKRCDIPTCEYDWKVSDWNIPVDWKCGETTVSREVGCFLKNNDTIASDHLCPLPKPILSRKYPDQANYPSDPVFVPCNNGWLVTSDWVPKNEQDCKLVSPCGQGERKRGISCYKDGVILPTPDPTICPDNTKPADSEACDTGISCDCCGVNKPISPEFCSCNWDVETKACPDFWNTTITANVDCKNQDKTKVVDPSNCKTQKPGSTVVCNPQNPSYDGSVVTIEKGTTTLQGITISVIGLKIPLIKTISKIQIPFHGKSTGVDFTSVAMLKIEMGSSTVYFMGSVDTQQWVINYLPFTPQFSLDGTTPLNLTFTFAASDATRTTPFPNGIGEVNVSPLSTKTVVDSAEYPNLGVSMKIFF